MAMTWPPASLSAKPKTCCSLGRPALANPIWLRPSATKPSARTFRSSIVVSGQSKPASDGQLKTGHLEGRIALSAADVAQGRDEQTQREPATIDIDAVEPRVVLSPDRS